MRIVINIVAFYAGWFGAALLAARGYGAIAALPCLAVAALHLATTTDRRAAAQLMAIAAVMGAIAETALLASGATRFGVGAAAASLPPLWLIALWVAFATTLNVSLAWLQSRAAIAAILGFLGGPAAYYAGAELGAMQLGQPLWASLGAIGLVWAIAMPLLLSLAKDPGRSGE